MGHLLCNGLKSEFEGTTLLWLGKKGLMGLPITLHAYVWAITLNSVVQKIQCSGAIVIFAGGGGVLTPGKDG